MLDLKLSRSFGCVSFSFLVDWAEPPYLFFSSTFAKFRDVRLMREDTFDTMIASSCTPCSFFLLCRYGLLLLVLVGLHRSLSLLPLFPLDLSWFLESGPPHAWVVMSMICHELYSKAVLDI